MEEIEGSTEVSRGYLLGKLKTLFEYCLRYVYSRQSRASLRAKWTLRAIQCAGVMPMILKDGDIDELKERIEKLEQAKFSETY